MEAILAGREDYAAALTELGFSDPGFRDALRNGRSKHQLDEFSGNARIVKAAMCAGAIFSCLFRKSGPVDWQQICLDLSKGFMSAIQAARLMAE